ncbi:hypothetical protein DUF2089 [Gottschalkia acidurici 9a]|uniref:DUF2089 domain-containing protein n=1 Tax=Gottschalkia acidurici (strain ATCC 7906 / DSM 604 / BCRC 14475 / CIP 104303 / KCTC 5404 / NCIMB 10678 / 9a) TaxID=1128398 RepID=K0B5T8_GOTA9|nr:DUF2089 family protein [Gottschalkia acidurici]AFS79851.1 hypothetical protein DUF2089 [Gottschalkia acidurici 9a]
MKKESIGKCPICSEQITITKMHCEYCETTIEGNFYLCKFCELDNKQKEFLEIFIRSRGNLKEVEKEIGISYPTIRNKLEEITNILNGNCEERNLNKEEILSRINSEDTNSINIIEH